MLFRSEFVPKSTPTSPYSGYYWKTSSGKYYTGKTPQDTPIEELIPIQNLSSPELTEIETNLYVEYTKSVSTQYYNYLKKINPNELIQVPTYYITFPAQQDYQIGEFVRYFCKKTNEIIYLEISKNTYEKLNKRDPSI